VGVGLHLSQMPRLVSEQRGIDVGVGVRGFSGFGVRVGGGLAISVPSALRAESTSGASDSGDEETMVILRVPDAIVWASTIRHVAITIARDASSLIRDCTFTIIHVRSRVRDEVALVLSNLIRTTPLSAGRGVRVSSRLSCVFCRISQTERVDLVTRASALEVEQRPASVLPVCPET